jgi:beta-lactamase class A
MKFKIFLFIISMLCLGSVTSIFYNKVTIKHLITEYFKPSPTQTPIPTQVPTLTPSPTKIPKEKLEDIIEKEMEGAEGRFGIVIKSLKTEDLYLFNEHEVFESGSLYKLWVMATVFDYIQKGKIKDTDQLSDSIANLNNNFNIASGEAELNSGYITFSVSDALEQMITVSHNYAALLLSKKVGLSNADKLMQENNLLESELGLTGGLPTITSYDAALFFEKLYKGELIHGENRDEMLSMLKRQKLNNKIPKYLPMGTTIAHKTGEIYGFSHDVGIVFIPQGDYIISILTESDNPSDTEDRIAKISKAVFDYMVN